MTNLNEEQQVIADHILSGGSCAVLAPGGRGKTYLLEQTLPKLKGVAVCCPTGAAAVNIGMGAMTAHKLFGIKPVIQTPDKFKNKVPDKYAKVLKRIKVLVIDEVGALKRDVFEAMDHKLRQVKGNDKPFGGVQLICTGDMTQTAPVLNGRESSFFFRYYSSKWVFTSKSFADLKVFTLNGNQRNKDERHNKIMDSIRKKDKYCALALQRLLEMATPYDPNSRSMVACQFNKDADKINEYKYSTVQAKEHTYYSVDVGTDKNLKDIPVGKVLKLKDGLRIMIIANDPSGQYVNGDMATIEQCEDDCVVARLDRNQELVVIIPNRWEVIEYKVRGQGLSQKVIASRENLPIRLGYASSIEKLQGQTLDSVVLNMGDLPEYFTRPGTFYVGISRVKDLSNISYVYQPTLDHVKVDPEVLKYLEEMGL